MNVMLSIASLPVCDTLVRTSCSLQVLSDIIHASFLQRCAQRYFAVSGPVTWNQILQDVRDTSPTAAGFSDRLKTELFDDAADGLYP